MEHVVTIATEVSFLCLSQPPKLILNPGFDVFLLCFQEAFGDR